MLYIVTAQQPTAVTHALAGHFTAPDSNDLVVAKSTRLELHSVTEEGISPIFDVGLHATIVCMESFCPPGSPTDLLFVLTNRDEFFVLGFSEGDEVKTIARGDARERAVRKSERGSMALVDPDHRCVTLFVHEGLIKVIPLGRERPWFGGRSFSVRIEERAVLDAVLLHGCARPTLAVLHEDATMSRHVSTYEIGVSDRSLSAGPWGLSDMAGAHMLMAPTCGGLVVVGDESVHVANVDGEECGRAAVSPPILARAFGRIDGGRFLVGDHGGGLHVVALLDAEGAQVGGGAGQTIGGVSMQALGRASVASALVYLGDAQVFVGSCTSDSQLVRLLEEPTAVEEGVEEVTMVEVVESYDSLGPIMDMDVVDLDRRGQEQVLTASGALGEGSVRIVRSGIGIDEITAVPLAGIRQLFRLRRGFAEEQDTFLVQSFAAKTRVLGSDEEGQLEEVELEGWAHDEVTLAAGNLQSADGSGDVLVQVTPGGVRMLAGGSLVPRGGWEPEEGRRVTLGSVGTANLVLVALNGGEVVLLEYRGEEGGLNEVGRAKLPHEVSCLALSQFGDVAKEVAVVGLWDDVTVRVLQLPTLEEQQMERLGGDIQSRSVLAACLGEGRVPFVLTALGDGQIVSFVVDADTGKMGRRRRVAVGTRPPTLSLLESGGTTHVLAACDRPTVISAAADKLSYANVNMDPLSSGVPFHTSAFPDALALATDSDLVLGTVDDIQKLHILTVPLEGEAPDRVSHHEPSGTVVLATAADVPTRDDVAVSERCFVRFLDDTTFEPVGSFELEPTERATSILSTTLSPDDPIVYVVVGTSHEPEGAEVALNGRILVFQVTRSDAAGAAGGRTVELVAERSVAGTVYALATIEPGDLVAAVNSRVQVFRWTVAEDEKQLVVRCGSLSFVQAITLQVRGRHVVVGDVLKSVSVLEYMAEEDPPMLREIARDPASVHITDIAAIADDHYLGAEDALNLFLLRRNAGAASDEERGRLDVVGAFHLGDQVNRFRLGSLVRAPAVEETVARSGSGGGGASAAAAEEEEEEEEVVEKRQGPKPVAVFGTLMGAIGVVISLPPQLYRFLKRVERALGSMPAVGGLKHAEWRAWDDPTSAFDVYPVQGSTGFIDGDLIEQALSLDRTVLDNIITAINSQTDEIDATAHPDGTTAGPTTADELLETIEELHRLH